MRVVLRADLGLAMRKREVRRINALRGLIAAIDNAEAVPLGDTGDDSEMRTRAVSANNSRRIDRSEARTKRRP